MESATRRAQLAAQIAELQDRQLESFTAATFEGWTPERNAEHQKRSDKMAAIQRELQATADP